jgi:hypothetical protein
MTRLVCLANSYKEGGRCLAGVELNTRNSPKLDGGRPKWIRPICDTGHGEVPIALVQHINLLDVIQLRLTEKPTDLGHQTENILFEQDSIEVIGRFAPAQLEPLCSQDRSILGNKGKAVPPDVIEQLSHSLVLINTREFELFQKTYENSSGKPQLRIRFSYHAAEYDLPITDPAFQLRYRANRDCLADQESLYLTISLGNEHEGWFYKLVAGVI